MASKFDQLTNPNLENISQDELSSDRENGIPNFDPDEALHLQNEYLNSVQDEASHPQNKYSDFEPDSETAIQNLNDTANAPIATLDNIADLQKPEEQSESQYKNELDKLTDELIQDLHELDSHNNIEEWSKHYSILTSVYIDKISSCPEHYLCSHGMIFLKNINDILDKLTAIQSQTSAQDNIHKELFDLITTYQYVAEQLQIELEHAITRMQSKESYDEDELLRNIKDNKDISADDYALPCINNAIEKYNNVFRQSPEHLRKLYAFRATKIFSLINAAQKSNGTNASEPLELNSYLAEYNVDHESAANIYCLRLGEIDINSDEAKTLIDKIGLYLAELTDIDEPTITAITPYIHLNDEQEQALRESYKSHLTDRLVRREKEIALTHIRSELSNESKREQQTDKSDEEFFKTYSDLDNFLYTLNTLVGKLESSSDTESKSQMLDSFSSTYEDREQFKQKLFKTLNILQQNIFYDANSNTRNEGILTINTILREMDVAPKDIRKQQDYEDVTRLKELAEELTERYQTPDRNYIIVFKDANNNKTHETLTTAKNNPQSKITQSSQSPPSQEKKINASADNTTIPKAQKQKLNSQKNTLTENKPQSSAPLEKESGAEIPNTTALDAASEKKNHAYAQVINFIETKDQKSLYYSLESDGPKAALNDNSELCVTGNGKLFNNENQLVGLSVEGQKFFIRNPDQLEQLIRTSNGSIEDIPQSTLANLLLNEEEYKKLKNKQENQNIDNSENDIDNALNPNSSEEIKGQSVAERKKNIYNTERPKEQERIFTLESCFDKLNDAISNNPVIDRLRTIMTTSNSGHFDVNSFFERAANNGTQINSLQILAASNQIERIVPEAVTRVGESNTSVSTEAEAAARDQREFITALKSALKAVEAEGYRRLGMYEEATQSAQESQSLANGITGSNRVGEDHSNDSQTPHISNPVQDIARSIAGDSSAQSRLIENLAKPPQKYK